jgi:hypothetical protein
MSRLGADEKVGAMIVKRALEEPIRQIVENAGLEGSVIVEKVKAEKGVARGFDADHRALPFLERNGEYWGLPADSQEAIREIERMRQSGCTHIVLAWPAIWWLDYYREMTEYLRTRSRCVLESDRLRIFDLRE